MTVLHRHLVVLLVLAILTVSTTVVPAADDVFTIDHDVKTRSVSQAHVSPDGKLVAFVLTVPRDPFADDDGGAWSELHVLGPDRDQRRAFVTGEVSVSKVAWLPDGSGIAFLAKREGDEEKSLYVIPATGGEARKVLEHETAISEYSFSPDGGQIAFLAKEPENKLKKKLDKKGFTAEVYEEELRFVRVHVARLEKGGASGEPRILYLEGSASELHWSPDGAHLAVALAPTPLIDDSYMYRQINVVQVADGAVVGVIETGGKVGRVAWSPDGRNLALLAGRDRHDPTQARLFIAPTTGGVPRELVPGLEADFRSVAFVKKDKILAVIHESVDSYLAEISVGDGKTKLLVKPGGPVMASVSASENGKTVIVTADSPTHPREVFHKKRGGLERMTDSNPWLGDLRLAPQEIVTWQARDGLELDGLLIRPLDESPGQRCPLIMVVHGGPEGHRSHGWLTRYSSGGQYAAARGFAVFFPNYRGSSGRGTEFAMLGQADYAGKEFDDLVDGVRHLVTSGLVDETRVGITGGSYGGYAAAWGATAQSEHFAAAVMFVGVSELYSKFGTTDIPAESYLVHARKYPWEDWDWLRDRSPIYHAQKHHTPLLILGGTDDPRVHPSQSLTMYRYLKVLDQAPVRLVRYPGEKHGNRKAAARMDYSLRMMRWLENYLLGPGEEMPPPELETVTERIEAKDDD